MRFLAIILSFVLAGAVLAQGNKPPADNPIDAATRQAVVEGALEKIRSTYVFPDVAQKMAGDIRARMQRNEYESITSPTLFAQTLTQHLQAISKDKHLTVIFTGNDVSVFNDQLKPEQYRIEARARNYSFEKVERLRGNVGYLDLRLFEDPQLALDAASAAMAFLANTDALIIDLRQNGGGEAEMVAVLSSYLFDKKTHLNDIYNRTENKTEESWTRDNVPGKKYGAQKPVFVLTSKFSFSAAEEFAYNLQSLKRATIVGEVTGGGAHPLAPHVIHKDFIVGVPYARAINPITKTNWEGVGVKPDIATPTALALKTAHVAALKAIQTQSSAPDISAKLKAALATTQRELDDLKAPVKSVDNQTAATIALPTTPAGKTFGAFLSSLNSGKLEALRQFHMDRGGNPDNAEQDMNFYQQSGGLKLHSVKRSTETEIEVIAQGKKDERWIIFSMSVAAEAPHGITGISIKPTSVPTEK